MGVSADVLLQIDNMEVVYHQILKAVQGISLQVRSGQIVALVGSNGAGKTTVLRAVSGFIGLDDARVTEGSVVFRGEHIENRQPHQITRKGIVIVPERDKVFENLSVVENLYASAPRSNSRFQQDQLYGMALDYFPRLAALRDRQAGYLSGGERQMLTMASALMCGPDLLLLDELSLGLAPIVVDELMRLLDAIRRDLGMTILLVEQNVLAALKVADYGYVIENGRIVTDGSPQQLLNHQDIKEFYLGQSDLENRKSYRDVKQYRRSRRWYG